MYQTNLRRVIKWTKIQTIVHRTKIVTTQIRTQTKIPTKTLITTQATTQIRIQVTTTTRSQKGESQVSRFPFLLTHTLSTLNIERRMQEDEYETV